MSDVSARILARMSVSVSASWNASFRQHKHANCWPGADGDSCHYAWVDGLVDGLVGCYVAPVISMSVWLSVRACISEKPLIRTSPIFSVCLLWLWLGPFWRHSDMLSTRRFADDVVYAALNDYVVSPMTFGDL